MRFLSIRLRQFQKKREKINLHLCDNFPSLQNQNESFEDFNQSKRVASIEASSLLSKVVEMFRKRELESSHLKAWLNSRSNNFLFLFLLDEITSSFRRYGPLIVDWPHKAESKSYFPPKGYAFLLFQVRSANCTFPIKMLLPGVSEIYCIFASSYFVSKK